MLKDSIDPLIASIPNPTVRHPTLVCFSHLRWDFVWQRPQQLLTRAASNYNVLFIEEPIFVAETEARLNVEPRESGVTIAQPMLPHGMPYNDVVAAQRRLIERLLGREAAGPRVFWYYTPMALAFTDELECDVLVYDNMDELSAFQGASTELLALENELFGQADVVFTGGMSLYEAKRSRHANVHCFPSSVDTRHFAPAREKDKSEPSDQAAISHPRFGFFGVIDERMNIDLVRDVAKLRPDWSFVMIGPVVKIDPAALPRPDNVHWLGAKPYTELPSYLRGWDIGFMPFALNESTRFISPTKTPEFLAAGLPVISTPIRDVIRPYGDNNLVEISATAAEVVAAGERLLGMSAVARETWMQSVDRQLSEGSWDKTWSAIDAVIRAALDGVSRQERQDAVPA